MRAIATKKQIIVRTDIAPELTEVTLDQQKVKQVLYNLLSNAIKFTDEEGRVEVVARFERDEHFRLEVTNTGIGIKPEDLNRLFRQFEQLETGTARRYEGSGLGLAPTKKLVELQHGQITVTSVPGQGSTFTIRLPKTI